jgi:hypothetical protein
MKVLWCRWNILTPDSKNNAFDLCSDEKSGDGDKHPWCSIDFDDDLMYKF